MTLSIALLFALIVIALVFFAFEWVSADVVGIGMLLFLVLTGLLPSERAFAGFGSDTTIMILSLLVMTAALIRTGMVDIVSRTVLRHAGTRPLPLLLAVVLAAAGLSSFISNTAATAFLIPVVLGVAAKARVASSQLLMPLAFASILASSVTLVSTSTNLVVSGLMTEAGLPRIRMFELAPVGLVIAGVGVVYLLVIGRRLMPKAQPAREPLEDFGLRSYLSEILILPKSPLIGKTLRESKLGQELDLHIVRVVRSNAPAHHLLPAPHLRLEVGDTLLVEGPREEVLKVKDTAGIEIRAEVTMPEAIGSDEETLVAEALVVPGSPLVGRTLRGMNFRDHYGVQVLGLHRHGQNLLRKLGRVTLRPGDLLLVQGRRSRITSLNEEHLFSAIGIVDDRRIDRPRAWRAAAIFAGTLALATLGVVPLAVAGFLGVFLVFVTRCVSAADAYREVEWRAVILIACMLGVGTAMHETGAADYLATVVVSTMGTLDPRWLLGGFFVLTVFLTQPMSNQAAAAVVVPIALATAQQLGLNPRPFAMMIAVAASCSFLTPLEPACLLVYGPGRYRFADFIRVGAPLTVLVFAIALWLVPRVWPLEALASD